MKQSSCFLCLELFTIRQRTHAADRFERLAEMINAFEAHALRDLRNRQVSAREQLPRFGNAHRQKVLLR